MNVNERLVSMSRGQLERFALVASGLISTMPQFADKHPLEAFEFIYKAVTELEANDDTT